MNDDAQAVTEDREDPQPGIRFEDADWDDAFCAWWDPTLRTCCG